MKRHEKLTIMGLIVCMMPLLAQDGQPRLEIEILEKKLNMTAEETAGETDIVYAPGDTIEYTIIARNTGDGIMKNAVVVNPIPEGAMYIVDSAKGDHCRIIFSVNEGMKYSVWPVMVSARSESGAPVQREASDEEVTHIKWMIGEDIPAAGQKQLGFQVMVE